MKNLLLFITLCLISVISKATTYYVATTGNDSNPGSITQPFKTWDKLSSVMVAGDIAYIRGGTYNSSKSNNTAAHCFFNGLTGTAANPIKIWAYPGEIPVLDLNSVIPTYSDPIGMFLLDCNYVHLKGLTIKNLKQIAGGSGISRGVDLQSSSNCTLELMEVYNIGGVAFKYEYGSNDNLFLNCDAHHVGDGLSDGGADAWDNSDGFSCSALPGGETSTRNTFDGCRAWFCADDGWDFFGTNGIVYLKNCQSFWNGVKPWGPSNVGVTPTAMTSSNYSTWHGVSAYNGGSGEGFKLGPAEYQQLNVISKFVNNCISFENRGTGYAANSDGSLTTKMQFYNNIAYKNDNDGFSFGAGWSVGVAHVFKNNWSWGNNLVFSGGDLAYDGLATNMSNNVWHTIYQNNYGNLYPSVSINNSDFITLSSVGVDGARQSNGSLPVLNFLRLANTSDLINKGVNIGLSYVSTSPDLGAYESNGTSSNLPPTANAGTDQNITLPVSSVNITGSGTDPDGSVSSYLWTKISGPTTGTITNTTSATTIATGLAQGAYQFELKVTDNSGVSTTDMMQVIVNAAVVNNLPIANASADKTITLPTSTVSLTGTGTDVGGSITAYLWTKVSGPTGGTIATTTAATTSITGMIQGVYKFELKVTDNAAATGRDTVQVTVNAAGNVAPIANAGADKTITLPTSTVSLTGTGTDVGGSITAYLWTKVSGPTGGTIATTTAATTSITGMIQGVYKFELKVTDNAAATGRDTIQLTVNAAGNVAPIANAGADKTITLPTSTVSLTGTGTDVGGSITAYLWTKVSGPTGGTIATTTAATTSITGMMQGVYKFELKVTDNAAATGKDTIQVTVNAISTPNNAYGGLRWSIPGTLEAENYDLGGQNVAYYDNTNGNNGASYRTSETEYVDITASSEGGYLVGWIEAGEWMKYSANVISDGNYTITTRVACPTNGKSFRIEMDGATIATVTVPNTGGSQTWKTVTINNINLTAGNKIMRIYASNGSGFNINYVKFAASTNILVRSSADSTKAVDVNTTVTTFPMPFSTSFAVNIFGETKGAYELTLADVSGKTVWKKTVTKNSLKITENIYMGNLPGGVYILQVVTPDQKRSAHQLIKN